MPNRFSDGASATNGWRPPDASGAVLTLVPFAFKMEDGEVKDW